MNHYLIIAGLIPHKILRISVDDLLVIGRAAFLVFSFIAAALTFSRWRQAAVRDTLNATAQAAQVLESLQRLEKLVALIDSSSRASSERVPVGGSQYQIAQRLARAGASREELMSACGLSGQEAELALRVYAGGGTRAAA